MRKKNAFYNELRKNVRQQQGLSWAGGNDACRMRDACLAVLHLADTAGKEGLLSLGIIRDKGNLEELICGMELSQMINIIEKGEEPDAFEDICWKRYYSQNLSGFDGVIFLFYLDALLHIQEGASSRVIEIDCGCRKQSLSYNAQTGKSQGINNSYRNRYSFFVIGKNGSQIRLHERDTIKIG